MNAYLSVFALYIIMLFAVVANAADKPQQKSCDVQLAEHSVRVHHLTTGRDEQERKIAELQTQLYIVQQQKQALEKQLESMKPAEPAQK